MKNRILFFILCIILIGNLSGCEKKTEKSNGSQSVDESVSKSKAPNVGQTVKINGIIVELYDYLYSEITKSGECLFRVTGLTKEELNKATKNTRPTFGGQLRFFYGNACSGSTKFEEDKGNLLVSYRFVALNDGVNGDSDSIHLCRSMEVLGKFSLKDNDINGNIVKENIKISSSSISIPRKFSCQNMKLLYDGGELVIIKDSKIMMLKNSTPETYKIIWYDKICRKKMKGIVIDGEYLEFNSSDASKKKDVQLENDIRETNLSDKQNNDVEIASGKAGDYLVKVMLKSGAYIEDDTSPYNDTYEGSFEITVYKNEKECSKLDYIYDNSGEGLNLPSGETIQMSDYNGDGQQDFAIGQRLSSSAMEYQFYTITDDGQLQKLQETLVADEGYFPLFKVENGKIQYRQYDQKSGKYLDKKVKFGV